LFRREKQAVRLGFVITLPRLWRLTIGAPDAAVPEPVQERCITGENRCYLVRKRTKFNRLKLIHTFAEPVLAGQGFALFLQRQPLVLGGGERRAGPAQLGHQPVEAGLVAGVQARVVEAFF